MGEYLLWKICIKVWTRPKTRISVLIRNHCVTQAEREQMLMTEDQPVWTEVMLILELFLNSLMTDAFFLIYCPGGDAWEEGQSLFHVFVILDSRLWRLFPPQLHQRTSSWILSFRAGAQTGFSTVCVLVFFPRTLRHKAFVGGLPACCSGAYMRGWRGGERGCCGDCRA